MRAIVWAQNNQDFRCSTQTTIMSLTLYCIMEVHTMSSYVVDPKTINIILNGISYASHYKRNYPPIHSPDEHDQDYPWMHSLLYVKDKHDCEMLGQSLYDLNINATMQRYPSNTINTLPGSYTDDTHTALATFSFTHVPTDKYRVYRAIKEYLYQCSEGDADDLELFEAISNWCDALAHNIANDFIDEQYPDKTGW